LPIGFPAMTQLRRRLPERVDNIRAWVERATRAALFTSKMSSALLSLVDDDQRPSSAAALARFPGGRL
jgi:hypothetical protein